jgi:hypothetical protein
VVPLKVRFLTPVMPLANLSPDIDSGPLEDVEMSFDKDDEDAMVQGTMIPRCVTIDSAQLYPVTFLDAATIPTPSALIVQWALPAHMRPHMPSPQEL